MSQHPSDMRIGVNGMCGKVRSAGMNPTSGDVFIFVGKTRNVMKILHWERGGYVMYYKRLEQGRFHPRIFLRETFGFRSIRWDELVLLIEGISPRVARRRRYETAEPESENKRKSQSKLGYLDDF
ncbi:IS66 family insertion sequence element accessory protein TnpB [Hallella sp.]|uniref:IS66 family insertion sequence element accessory protein TnpB n=1 Tax=Hallella sp. TaxID=2980186 RepID=UPI003079B0AD